MRIAFYSPMTAPDAAMPSGDRQMARQLRLLLEGLGHDIRMLSRLRTFFRAPDLVMLDDALAVADGEVRRIETEALGAEGWRPDVWFTYHLHYKAPDLVGARVARRLGVPYVVAEASYAGKRDRDDWAPFQEHVAAALEAASAVLVMTQYDRPGLIRRGLAERLVDFPPFLADPVFLTPQPERHARAGGDALRIVTVAMMRPGDKLESYRLLAETLAGVPQAWHLTVAGDGPAQRAVHEMLAAQPRASICWLGAVDRDAVREALDNADVFLWPGYGEAYGMAYLEAAARGLPAVALATAGVPSVVRDGHTGLLAGDADGLAAALRRIIAEPGLGRRLGDQARRFVVEERSEQMAASILQRELGRVALAAVPRR